ncbi:MAG: tetratricopeptide repeat protein [Acidobacteriota bacterium]
MTRDTREPGAPKDRADAEGEGERSRAKPTVPPPRPSGRIPSVVPRSTTGPVSSPAPRPSPVPAPRATPVPVPARASAPVIAPVARPPSPAPAPTQPMPPRAPSEKDVDTAPSLPVARPNTLDELELDEVAEPPAPSEPALAPEARAVIATCESELETSPTPLRAARLHYEIARAYEAASGWAAQAADHYRQALEGAPDFIPAIRGARRAAVARGNIDAALALYDSEDRLTASPGRKAILSYEKGRLVEDALGDISRARELYAKALELDPTNASVIKALEQCDRQNGKPEALVETFELAINAIPGDDRHRAALVVERARLIEKRGDDAGPAAAEVYETALKLDPKALGANDALARIYRRLGQWSSLTTALEREAKASQDLGRRALVLQRLARIQTERLGNRHEAISALVKANDARANDRLVLEDLAREYEREKNFHALAEVLAALVELAPGKPERAALLHRLGLVLEGQLADPERAIQRYHEALALEPTSLPVLQALGHLLSDRKQWAALVDMHLIEANATPVAARAAAAHARVAEICETKLRDSTEAVNHHARALTLVPGYPASFKALTRLYAQLDRHRELVELLERAVDEAKHTTLKIAYLMKIGSVWEDSLADPPQALHAYQRVLELDPDDLVAIHAVQRVAERAERHAQHVAAIEREAELVDDRDHRVGLYHRAGTVLDELVKDHDAALLRFRKALELDPAFVPALASVGRIYHGAGRWQELLEIYEREVKATTGADAVGLLHKMGELCEDKLADLPAAVALYRRALELDPTYRPAIRALVRRCRESADWKGLVQALETDVASTDHAPTRAGIWFEIGQHCEDWLDDVEKAITAYRRALEARADYRPARVALARLYGEKGEWMQLIDVLSQETAVTDDTALTTSVLVRQGEVYRDKLDDPDLAIHCFEAVQQHEQGLIAALLALEPLYARANAFDKLATVYADMGAKLKDPGARIAALRELARLQQTKKLGTAHDRVRTYEAILKIDPDDEWALVALEELGRTMRDDAVLVDVYRRLADIADNPSVAACYLTDLGQALERRGDRRALDAYKDAVAKDPGILTAIRGLARVGDLLGNPRAMAQAARLEAELTRRPEMAAKLFVRSGILRREQMNDLGAVEDFEKALEVWPDDAQAAERIMQPLLETGQVLRLVDILAKTAGLAKSSERRTALWLEVGGLYARRLDNLGAGITAFKRALDATPGHVPTLSKLSEAYEKNRQWGDAVATLEQLLALTSDDTVRQDAHLKLAAIFDEHLNKPDRATKSVEAVLRGNPKHAGALQRLADIQLRSGNEAEAVVTTQRLVDLAEGPKQKGAALVRVARIQRKRGEAAAADTALGEALSLEGPGGDAERDLKKAIERHGNWVGYAAGLAAYIKRAIADKEPTSALVTAYLELGKTYTDHMGLPARAVDALTEGLDVTNGDQRLVLALARQLREVGRLDEALQHLKQAVALDPVNVAAWRELSVLFERGGRIDDANRALAAVAVLGAPVDREIKGLGRPAIGADNSLGGHVLVTIAVDNALAVPAANLLAAIGEPIGKLYPPSLEQYGITARDRLGPKAPTPQWELASQIARMFGTELEMYEHPGAQPFVIVEPFDNPALVVSSTLRRLPVAQQAFLLAYGIMLVATRLHPVLSLRTGELEIALAGAARVTVPTFNLNHADETEVNNAREIVRKTVTRKWRRQMELASEELVQKPPGDLARWQGAVRQTALRVALLVANDLAASIDAMRLVVELPDVRNAVLVQSSDAVSDLLRFWISNRAASVRQHAGMVRP